MCKCCTKVSLLIFFKGGVYLVAFSRFSTTLRSLKTKFIKIDFSHWLFLRASPDLLTEDLAFLLPSHSGIEMHPAVCTHEIISSNQEFYTKAMFFFFLTGFSKQGFSE